MYYRLDSLRSDSKGATVIEAAITLPVFLLALLCFVELTRLHYYRLSLQHTIGETARWAILGKEIAPFNRLDSIKEKAVEVASSFGIPLDQTELRVCPLVDPSCTTESAGNPDQFVHIAATHRMEFLYLNFAVNVTATAAIRNEPFD